MYHGRLNAKTGAQHISAVYETAFAIVGIPDEMHALAVAAAASAEVRLEGNITTSLLGSKSVVPGILDREEQHPLSA